MRLPRRSSMLTSRWFWAGGLFSLVWWALILWPLYR